MKIYTKKGDRGETGLPGDRRLSKTDQLFETLGYLDQTSAFVGLAVSLTEDKKSRLVDSLQTIQSNFLSIGACLASTHPADDNVLAKLPGETEKLELEIDAWNEVLPPLRNFILAGGTSAAAALHAARASIRTAERNFHRLPENQKLSEISQYLNRLSDYFFQAARFTNHQNKQPDIIWQN